MIVLTDCDILLKLATVNLLDDFPAAYGLLPFDVYVGPDTPFSVRSRGRRRKWGDAVVNRVTAFLQLVQTIDTDDLDERALLTSVADIDSGEIALLIATKHHADAFIATGDKRCLKALHDAPAGKPVYQRNCGRVICFEQIVLRLIDHLGFGEVCSRVVPGRDCDQVLRVAFGSGMAAQEDSVRIAFGTYISQLRLETGDLLSTVLP